jgi:hypothetical protein
MAPQQKGDDHVEKADAHSNLGMIMSGPAAPILKSFLGIGSTTAYAQNDDDQGEDNDDQGENEQ